MEYEIEEIEVALLDDNEIEEAYKDMLNEQYEEVIIADIPFSASEILENCDPTAYRVGLADIEEDLQEYVTCYEVNGERFDDEDVAQTHLDILNESEEEEDEEDET